MEKEKREKGTPVWSDGEDGYIKRLFPVKDGLGGGKKLSQRNKIV